MGASRSIRFLRGSIAVHDVQNACGLLLQKVAQECPQEGRPNIQAGQLGGRKPSKHQPASALQAVIGAISRCQRAAGQRAGAQIQPDLVVRHAPIGKKFSATTAREPTPMHVPLSAPSSSCSSRARASHALSPGSIAPPGRAQKLSPSSWCSNTRPPWMTRAAARWRTHKGGVDGCRLGSGME